MYSLFCKAKKPSAKKVDAKSNKVLQRNIKRMNSKGDVLFETQIGSYYPLGGEKIRFTKDDMNKIKNFESPGLTLVGFKPKDKLKVFHNLRTSYFVYPDEERVAGSSSFSDALIKGMIEKELIGIVKLVPRNNQELRFAALMPQKEKYDPEDHFQTPPGFHLIVLPFADDIVNFVGNKTESLPAEISRELLGVTKLLINNLTIKDFDFRNFENPSLQKFYTYLQAHALNDKDVRVLNDLLQPDHEGFKKYSNVISLVQETLDFDAKNGVVKKEEEEKNGDSGITNMEPMPAKYSKAKKEVK